MKVPVPGHIKELIPYPPGKPIEELEREYGISGSIKMASNENSLGPSPKAIAAVTGCLANLHRYPDGSCHYLARRLARHLDLPPEQLVFGNGSDEIIAMLAMAFVQPGDEVISSFPSFLVYPKVTQAQGGVNVVVPLRDMGHDLDAIADRVTERTRLIFLDNPNNPTGTFFGRHAFERFLSRLPDHVLVVLDEAYFDFVEEKDRIDVRDYLNRTPAVAALRTFSKAYGLAGLRIGYGIMDAEIADCLHRVRGPFNVNIPAQVAAMAALDDADHYRRTLEMTRSGIAWLRAELTQLGLTVHPTHTNFFLVELGRDGRAVYEAMLRKGVIIRPMTAYGFPQSIRITVGTEAENQRLVRALTEVLDAAP